MNNAKAGFTLIEIIVALAILAAAMRFIIPNIRSTNPRYEREKFVARLNSLTQLAWQRALVTHKIQRITFEISKKRIALSEQTSEREHSGEFKFVPAKGGYVRSSLDIPNNIDIKSFVIEGKDEMGSGIKTADAWFYVIPEGLAQEVAITFADKKDRVDNKIKKFKLDLNPFNAQFSLVEL